MPACGADLGRAHIPSPTYTTEGELSHLQGSLQLFERGDFSQLCLLSPGGAQSVSNSKISPIDCKVSTSRRQWDT